MSDRLLYVIAQFDEDTSSKMKDIEFILNQAGFVGKQTPAIPPHITLGSFIPTCEVEIKQRLQSMSSSFKSFNLSFYHIGLFGLKVMFFAPDVNHELLDLHQCINENYDYKHDWTAHVTILIDEPEIILKALPVVVENFSCIKARVERVSLYEFWPTRFIAEYKLL